MQQPFHSSSPARSKVRLCEARSSQLGASLACFWLWVLASGSLLLLLLLKSPLCVCPGGFRHPERQRPGGVGSKLMWWWTGGVVWCLGWWAAWWVFWGFCLFGVGSELFDYPAGRIVTSLFFCCCFYGFLFYNITRWWSGRFQDARCGMFFVVMAKLSPVDSMLRSVGVNSCLDVLCAHFSTIGVFLCFSLQLFDVFPVSISGIFLWLWIPPCVCVCVQMFMYHFLHLLVQGEPVSQVL